mgnify:CR=1 FL=1
MGLGTVLAVEPDYAPALGQLWNLTLNRRMELSPEVFEAEMRALFADHLPPDVVEEAIANTVRVAEKVENYDILGRYQMPRFPIPEGHTAVSYLTTVAEQGLHGVETLGGLDQLVAVGVEKVELQGDYAIDRGLHL